MRTIQRCSVVLLAVLMLVTTPCARADYKFVGNVTATNLLTGVGGVSSSQWAKVTSYILFGGATTATLPTPPAGQSGILLDTTTSQVKVYNVGAAAWQILPSLASGTTNTVAKFTSATGLGNSGITDNGTTITHTEAVVNQGSLNLQTVSKTASYNLANETVILVDATSGNQIETLPAPSSGRVYMVKKTDSSANTVTVAQHAAETIDGATSIVLANQYDSATVLSDGTNWFTVARQISPLTVARGGTGQTTLANHGVVVGAGTSGVSVTAVGTTGQVLTGNTGADPTWQAAAGSTLQAVMTAGATSTVATPMTLSPTSGAALSATVADNHYAITANGGSLGDGLQTNTSGDKISLDVERNGPLPTTAPLLNIHDAGQSASTADLIKAIGNSNTPFFELSANGNATFSALANAGFLSTDGAGKFVVNSGTPLTGNPSWDMTLSTSNVASHPLAFGSNNTYAIGTSTVAPSAIYSNAFYTLYSAAAHSLIEQTSATGLAITNDDSSADTITLTPGGGNSSYVSISQGAFAGNGMIRGQASTAASTTVAVSFPFTMGTTPVGIEITPLGDPTTAGVYWVSGISTSGFTINTKNASTLTFSWIAIQ